MPNFVSPGAMAGNALQQFLMQRELENQERMKAELLAQREAQEQQMREQDLKLRLGAQDLQRDQFAAGEAERARVATRQGAMDAQAESDRNLARSREQNELGLRKMTGAGRRAGLDPETLRLQAWEEGMDIPPGILDPGQASREAEAEHMRAHQNRLAEIAAQGEQSRRTAEAGRTAATPNASRHETADTLSLLDELETHPGFPKAYGIVQGRLSEFSQDATDAVSVRDQLVAALSLPNLGLLKGPASDNDVRFIKQRATRLSNPLISHEEAKRAISEAREYLRRRQAEEAGMGRTSGPGPGPAAGGGRQRWDRDAQGRPVRIQ